MSSKNTFQVTSYNVLATCYIRSEYYPDVNPVYLDNATRKQRLVARIQALGSGLYLLQEVESDLVDLLHDQLPHLEGVFFPRQNRKDGSAIFLDRRVGTLLDSRVLPYQNSDAGELAGIARIQVGSEVLSVASTHLRWEKGRVPLEKHRGYLQIQELLAEIVRVGGRWLVGGDFNATPESPVLRAAYEVLEESCGGNMQATVSINQNCRKLDYLLGSPGFVATPLPLPVLARNTVMPSGDEPSDHLPLTVSFGW